MDSSIGPNLVDFILNEKFVNYFDKFYIYENPTATEWSKYIAIGSRGWISPLGDLYLEGYEEKNSYSQIIHKDFFKGLADVGIIKDYNYIENYYYNSEYYFNIEKYGLAIQRKHSNKEIVLGESIDFYAFPDTAKELGFTRKNVLKLYHLAKEKNPDVEFSLERSIEGFGPHAELEEQEIYF